MRFTFKYRKANDKSGNKILRPEIEVKLANGSKSQKAVALLDSGADTCFIPRVLAERLGLGLDGKPTITKGVGGKIGVFESTINIEISGGHEKAILENVPVTIPKEDGETAWILLGRAVFFEYFEINFRQAADQIVLKKAEASPY
ncbi:retroviral-like aspartic protease family protein [Candidatus Micrarchaeota archaeon]|nr:retroviral-like aspartic protease family protein [Candidatus Micrarchaeota archaeon]